MEPEPVSEELKGSKPEGLVNKFNPYERKETTRVKILETLSKDTEREWSVTEMADEIGTNFQSTHIMLLELVIEGKVMARVPAEYRRVYKLNTEHFIKDAVKREIGTPLFDR